MLSGSIAERIAYALPKSVLYWAIIRVWADLSVHKFSDRVPEDITVIDALKEYGSHAKR